MPDPIVTALIALVGGIAGGLITTFGKPWGQDWVASRAEERAEKRAHDAEARRRLERVVQFLGSISVEGPHTATAEREERELPATAHMVNDPALMDAVDRMWKSSRSSAEWSAAWLDASQRAGQLLSTR